MRIVNMRKPVAGHILTLPQRCTLGSRSRHSANKLSGQYRFSLDSHEISPTGVVVATCRSVTSTLKPDAGAYPLTIPTDELLCLRACLLAGHRPFHDSAVDSRRRSRYFDGLKAIDRPTRSQPGRL